MKRVVLLLLFAVLLPLQQVLASVSEAAAGLARTDCPQHAAQGHAAHHEHDGHNGDAGVADANAPGCPCHGHGHVGGPLSFVSAIAVFALAEQAPSLHSLPPLAPPSQRPERPNWASLA